MVPSSIANVPPWLEEPPVQRAFNRSGACFSRELGLKPTTVRGARRARMWPMTRTQRLLSVALGGAFVSEGASQLAVTFACFKCQTRGRSGIIPHAQVRIRGDGSALFTSSVAPPKSKSDSMPAAGIQGLLAKVTAVRTRVRAESQLTSFEPISTSVADPDCAMVVKCPLHPAVVVAPERVQREVRAFLSFGGWRPRVITV